MSTPSDVAAGPPIHTMRRLGAIPVALVWFGPLEPSKAMGSAVPSLRLVTQRLTDRAGGDSGGSQFTVTVPVAFLRLFRLGDIWQNGQCRGSQPLERVTFEGLVIDEETCETMPSGVSTAEDDGSQRFLLPFRDFDAHRDHTKSFVAKVDIDDGRRLIVPSVELVRFYFGDSGSLVSAIFSGALAARELYSSARKDTAGVANVELGPRISGMAAAAVARIALDDMARRSFRWIVNSGVAASANRQPWYPRMDFPFVGKTDLTVEGRWLNSERRSFLAYRLLRCTHPFPFSSLYYRTPFTNRTANVRHQSIDADENPAREASDARSALQEGETARGLTPTALPVSSDDLVPFPDLLNKRVVRARTHRGGGAGAAAPEGATVGPESTTGQIRAVDVVADMGAPQEDVDVPQQMLDFERAVLDQSSLMSMSPDGTGQLSAVEVETDEGPILAWWALVNVALTDDRKASMVAISIDQPSFWLEVFDCTGRSEHQVEAEVSDLATFVFSSQPKRTPTLTAERKLFSMYEKPPGVEPMKSLLFEAWDLLSDRYGE